MKRAAAIVNHLQPVSDAQVVDAPGSKNQTESKTLSFQTLETKLEENSTLLWVGLNRPQQLNTFNTQMINDLHDLFDMLNDRPSISVVIFYGNGKAFSGGLDLQVDPSSVDTMWKGLKSQRRISTLFTRMRRLPQIFICATHGATCGAGFALALASDIRIAGESSRFNVAMRRIGMTGCDLGISYFLPRIVGTSLAAEMMYTGEFVVTDRALSSGLVSRVVPDAKRLEVAKELASKMLSTAPMGLNMTKECLNFSIDAPSLESVVAMEDRQQTMTLMGGDFQAGVAAFLTKQPAVFEKLS